VLEGKPGFWSRVVKGKRRRKWKVRAEKQQGC
jgi:hypothetical protein